MNIRPSEKLYMNRADLHERGWSDSTIRRFLGEPNATKPNPFYRSAAPIRLYLRQRVEEVESTEAWFEERSRTEHRRAIAAKATATKKAKLLAQLDALDVEVPRLPMDTLTRRACAHYNRRKRERAPYYDDPRDSDYNTAMPQSNPGFLARIIVNYLRHRLSNYESELEGAVKIGIAFRHAEINRRVYTAIAAAYPSLADECQRQLAAKIGRIAS